MQAIISNRKDKKQGKSKSYTKETPYYVKGIPSHFLQENVRTLKEAIPQLMPAG